MNAHLNTYLNSSNKATSSMHHFSTSFDNKRKFSSVMKNNLRKKSNGKEDLNATTIRFQDRIARLDTSPDDFEQS